MSIAPGVPLQPVATPIAASSAELLQPHAPSSPHRTADSYGPLPAFHIAASPAALSDHQQSTAAVLSNLRPSQPLCAPTDVEDLILLDGSLRRRPPVVPAYCPYRVQLQPGRSYRWCACGRSKKQPWCDDSHTPTDPQPLTFRVDVQQTLHYLCGCKYTSRPPYCDGSHIHTLSGTEEQSSRPLASLS